MIRLIETILVALAAIAGSIVSHPPIQATSGAPLDINALLFQLPLVGLVVWLINYRDKMWQEFFKEYKHDNAEAMAGITRALAILADEVKATNVLMQKHDIRVQSALPSMIAAAMRDEESKHEQ